MKYTKKLTKLCILLLLLTSCNSDDDSSGIEQSQIRVKVINANNIYTYDVAYNEDGRISSIDKNSTGGTITILYAYNAQNQPTQKGEALYTYNSVAKLSTITTPTYTSNLTYDSEGKIALEEVVASNYTIDRTFTYNTQGLPIEVLQHFVSNTIGIAPYKKYLITYNNNDNITKVLEKQSSDNITYVDRWESKYGYDNKNSPILNLHENTGGNFGLSYHIGILHSYGGNYVLTETPYLYKYSKNNLLFYTRTDLNNNKEYKTTYEYQYNEDGYPDITTLTIFNPNSQTSDEIIYTWTYEKK
ncbi:hypothetical protein [uncultured Aquimarina sp.]|uniref:hypothetical protein n=1 Tax=uncultured Aquimarina sp. TaxID=575652 RepID=UPI00262C921D|nr:hypothetical protein [uncultured Aquimarina sp.]